MTQIELDLINQIDLELQRHLERTEHTFENVSHDEHYEDMPFGNFTEDNVPPVIMPPVPGPEASLEEILKYNLAYIKKNAQLLSDTRINTLRFLVSRHKSHPEEIFVYEHHHKTNQRHLFIVVDRTLSTLNWIPKKELYAILENTWSWNDFCFTDIDNFLQEFKKNCTLDLFCDNYPSRCLVDEATSANVFISEIKYRISTTQRLLLDFQTSSDDKQKIYEVFSEIRQNLCSEIEQRAEELAGKLNAWNLKTLQEKVSTVSLTTAESRLSYAPPKSSTAKFLVSEEIRDNPWTNDERRYYVIRRRYEIPIEDTTSLTGYRSAFRLAHKMKFSGNTEKHYPNGHFYPPHVHKNTILHQLNFFKIEERVRTKYKDLSESSINMLLSFAHCFASHLKDNLDDYIENILKQAPKGLPVHDVIYPYLNFPTRALTPTVTKYLFSLPSEELQKWEFLQSFFLNSASLDNNFIKTFRKLLYNGIRKGLSAEEIREQLNTFVDEKFVKDYNLTHDQLEFITKNYLPVLRRYSDITTSEFLRIFGKRGIQTILKKNKKSVFQPKEYRLPSMEKTALAAIVNDKLGCIKDPENLKTRKKLYHNLNSILPIQDILAGKIPDELVPQIKRTLGLSPNKDLNLAGHFTAKIEKRCSPESLIAGDASVCCMGIHSEKARDYALNPGFAIFNVYFKGRIIANSVLWVNNKDTLVIDNVEVHPNYQHHDAYIREMYNQMIQDMSKQYKNIVQGASYNDLVLYDIGGAPCGTLATWSPVQTPAHFYSDAERWCYLVRGDPEIFRSRIFCSIDEFVDLPEEFDTPPTYAPNF